MIEKVAEQDCETPEDIAIGLCYAIQEHIRFPVAGKVIGEDVTVVGVEEGDGIEVMAICERKGRKYRVRLQDVRLTARPRGVEWIDAYAQFRRSGG
ncbi:MAG: hypothetical protein IVW52_20435 [Acidimicrobiales bacterium]|nr:hypothetical protein [Acidimicrobiales bacterium]